MRAVLDTCVLFPPVLRSVLLAVAQEGVFEPIWSARSLEEWRGVAGRYGDDAVAEMMGASALMGAAWPKAVQPQNETVEARLYLPDPTDIHVLAAAITGRAEKIITFNLKDFPKRELIDADVVAENPDAFLYGLWLSAPASIERAVAGVHETAEAMAGGLVELRVLLKRAKLPRLGKALA